MGAIWPAKTKLARMKSVFAVRMRVTQKASVPMTQFTTNMRAAARITLGTKRTRWKGSVSNRAPNVRTTPRSTSESGTIVVSLKMRLSTTA